MAMPEPIPAPEARPDVERLRGYSAPLEGRRGLLRLDFNENTIGPSPAVTEAIRSYPADQVAVYPEYDGLREALIANLQASPAGPRPSPDHRPGGALQRCGCRDPCGDPCLWSGG